jgi:hypothetical protein
MDANFRLKNRQNKSTDTSDPCLTNGAAYFVPEDDYKLFVSSSRNQSEVRVKSNVHDLEWV